MNIKHALYTYKKMEGPRWRRVKQTRVAGLSGIFGFGKVKSSKIGFKFEKCNGKSNEESFMLKN